MTEESSTSWYNWNNKTWHYCGKVGHVKKMCWKNYSNLEENVKQLEGDVAIVQSTSRSTYNVETCQALHVHTSKNEWVVDSGWTHHMVKDASLFFYLDTTI